MTEIEISRFVPEEGDVVELPETVGRVDTYNDSAPASGERFTIAVVGRGVPEEHVLLSTPLESGEIEDGAQVLAAYVSSNELWYAVPKTAYGAGGN